MKPPGLYFETAKAPQEIETLRTDIAAFLGPTERGPLGRMVRVTGWRDYVAQFGGETAGHETPFCLRGYFENGGETAHVERVLAGPAAVANAVWKVGDLSPGTSEWMPDAPTAAGFTSARYTISASSPGAWGNGLRVTIHYLLRGVKGEPELTMRVVTEKGETEQLAGISPASLEEQVAERSHLVKLEQIDGFAPAPPGNNQLTGPLRDSWGPIILQNGSEQPASLPHYLTALEHLLAEPEVALIVLPDMYATPEPYKLLAMAAAQADAALDRQVIASPPLSEGDVRAAGRWAQLRRRQFASRSARSVAVFHPWLDVKNPLGGEEEPLRRIPPVGHVAGLISRLDRERGAHHTPANAFLHDAVDTSRAYGALEQGMLTEDGLNPIRCRAGRGLEVWGGRTMSDGRDDPEGLYLAHRRLIHRLVRAIRRVAAPLVFSNNGPRLRLVLVRAITTVLLQAFRSGALKGERPEQAFRIVCDHTNNPPDHDNTGRVQCDIQLAPAVPMEFITLRIAISSEGRLEVIDA